MAAQRVSGLWFIVNGLKKTINYRLSTPIKSESTINYHRFGFSLIELMIVIALFSITTIVVTTSYISFQGREILKNAALQLKSDLRQAQNSAQVGDKVSNDDVGCASYDTSTTTVSPTVLGGWYLYITNGGTSYTISGVCMDKAHSYFERPFGSKTSNFPNGVTISSITCGPPATGTLADGDNFYIFFQPLTNNVTFISVSGPPINEFFDDSAVLNSGCLTGNGESVITVHSDDGSYEIHITQSGQINETRI